MILRPPPGPRQQALGRLHQALAEASQPSAYLLDPLDRARGLLRLIPLDLVLAALKRCGKLSRRRRRLPAECVVWLVIAQSLFRDRGIPKVWRKLHSGRGAREPSDSAFGQARQRLGERPLRALFRRVACWLGRPGRAGVFFKRWRKVALDGTVVGLPDTPANRAAFGAASNQHGDAAFPQLRLAALCELGTHAVVDVQLGPYASAETKLCGPLLNRLPPGCLVLLDRGLSYYWLTRAARLRGCEVLARVKAQGRELPVERVLPDGSYRSTIYPNAQARRLGGRGIAVRVIRYTHQDPALAGCGEPVCLITTIVDARVMSAGEAVETYPWRWEEELAFKEMKEVLLKNKQPLLRGKAPALVAQEVYGWLLAHWVVRRVMADAAGPVEGGPARLSYKHSLEVLEDRLKEKVHGAGRRWYAALRREVGQQVLRDKRERPYPRVKKANRKRWPTKRAGAPPPVRPTRRFAQAVHIIVPNPEGPSCATTHQEAPPESGP